MRVSVIVPIYNVQRSLLEACLDSVVKQTLRAHEYEIVLVDDCSADPDTVAVIDAFAANTENIQIVRHEENRGVNESRRSGVHAANGNHVLFVDGDDMLTRDAAENLRMRALQTGADLVTAPAFRWVSRTSSYSPLSYWARPLPSEYVARLKAVLACEHSFTMCGRLFKREILRDDVFDMMPRQLHEDLSTFARIAFQLQAVAHIRRPIYYYTLNEEGLTGQFTSNHVQGHFRAFNDWIDSARRHDMLDELSDSISHGVQVLVNSAVRRCLQSEALDPDEKVDILTAIDENYGTLPLDRPKPSLPGTMLLQRLHAGDGAGRPTRLQEAIELTFPKGIPKPPEERPHLDHSLIPTEIARRMKDNIVFVCQVDYQLRNAAVFARELRRRGYPCAVLDNSAFAAAGLRRLPARESHILQGLDPIRITKPPYDPDWLSTARLVITFNDFNDDFREALEYRNRLGLPTACMIEGINDFLRVDFQDLRHLPYRRCDYVFLAGDDDEKYFHDRQTYSIGLPVIESLGRKVPAFPDKPLAVLNVNFTYGALEEARDLFITTAKNAFEAAACDWLITKHPMDKGDLRDYPVSNLTQYELIDRCSVFVSRFATGILEALASGKPAIYFNPHGEKVEKFRSPMGAYQIAHTQGELVQALQQVRSDIESGVDFRNRALPFLEWHTGYRPDGDPVTHRLADAVTDIVGRHRGEQAAVSDLFFERLQEQEPFESHNPGTILGDFEHRHRARLPEEDLIARYFGEKRGIMLCIGAAQRNAPGVLFANGWAVRIFEPDADENRAAVAATGTYDDQTELDHVDFLVINGDGPGRQVTEALTREGARPAVVLARSHGVKTAGHGWSAHQLAGVLLRRGYAVYASEWLSTGRGGGSHHWKRLVRYSHDLELASARCNMIGFLEDPGEYNLRSLARQALKFCPRPHAEAVAPATPKRPRLVVRWYQSMLIVFGPYVVRKHPRLANMYKKMRDRGLLPQ